MAVTAEKAPAVSATPEIYPDRLLDINSKILDLIARIGGLLTMTPDQQQLASSKIQMDLAVLMPQIALLRLEAKTAGMADAMKALLTSRLHDL